MPIKQRPAVTLNPNIQLPKPQSIILENGLKILYFPRKGQHLLSLRLVIDLPITIENIPGISYLLSLSIDEGSKHKTSKEFSRELEQLGAGLTLESNTDGHIITMSLLPDTLTTALELLLEILLTPRLDSQTIENLKTQTLAGFRRMFANNSALSDYSYQKLIFPKTSRHRYPIPGDLNFIPKIQAADLKNLYLRSYNPAAATLILVGDFPDNPLPLISKMFSPWSRLERVIAPPYQQITVPKQNILIERPNAVQADLNFGKVTINRNHPDWIALKLATYIIGGGFGSRINSILREEKGFTYGADISLVTTKDFGIMTGSGAFQPEHITETFELLTTLLDLENNPITELELAQAKTAFLGSLAKPLMTSERFSFHIADLITTNTPLNFLESCRDQVLQADTDSCNIAFTKHLASQDLSWALVGPPSIAKETQKLTLN